MDFSDEIDIKEILLVLWNRKRIISIITTISAIFSVLYALSIPNIYKSSALLAPANEEKNLTSSLGQYSALAGMAGVQLPANQGNSSTEAIARMKSFDFFSMHFLPFINLEDLVAAYKWDSKKDLLLYKTELYDTSTNKWVSREIIPSSQEAYAIYLEKFSINENAKTGFVSISMEHFSPDIAKEWLIIIIKNINESMRQENISTSSKSINFLKDQLESTNLEDIRDGISFLLESQMQNLMLASASKSYIYKVINSPIAPERKSAPARSFICMFITFVGFILGCIYALLKGFREKV